MSFTVVYVFASIFPVIGVNPVMFNVERWTCYVIYFRHDMYNCVVERGKNNAWVTKRGDIESPICSER